MREVPLFCLAVFGESSSPACARSLSLSLSLRLSVYVSVSVSVSVSVPVSVSVSLRLEPIGQPAREMGTMKLFIFQSCSCAGPGEPYRGTSLMRNDPRLEPFSRTMPGAIWWP